MDQEDKKEKKKIISGRQMSRREIVEAVTEPDSVIILGEKTKKSIAIPTASSIETDIEKAINEADIDPNTIMDQVVRLFCKEKRVSAVNARVFIVRIKNMNREQLKVVRLLCVKKEFTSTHLLETVQSIKRVDGPRLLALRSFVELEGLNPGLLHQFFMTFLTQSNRDEVGVEAYEEEILEKMMTPGQNNAFYHICSYIEGIKPSDAISMLRKVRKLKPQHTHMVNKFLKKGAAFGGKPIRNDNIMNLVKLFLILPELENEKTYKRLIKKISKKAELKQDFQFIVQSYKDELVKERSGKDTSFIKRLFT